MWLKVANGWLKSVSVIFRLNGPVSNVVHALLKSLPG
jgi:hypothetical protein